MQSSFHWNCSTFLFWWRPKFCHLQTIIVLLKADLGCIWRKLSLLLWWSFQNRKRVWICGRTVDKFVEQEKCKGIAGCGNFWKKNLALWVSLEAVDRAAMAIHQQILIALLVLGFCFYSLGEAKVEKKTLATARKEDVPFIKCSVCEAIAKQLVRQVKEKREKSAPKKVFTSFIRNYSLVEFCQCETSPHHYSLSRDSGF